MQVDPHQAYQYKQSVLNTALQQIQLALFRQLTRKSQNLFLRGADQISAAPQVTGNHEPHVRSFIEHYANAGYGDFLIDIGANIGLTSCQSGGRFRQVHMFEPNPDCFSILRVNARISLAGTDYRLYEFGLGEANERKVLNVPRHNWGGAFIDDEHNSYSAATLASKDGFDHIDPQQYLRVEIQIAAADEVFRNLFCGLMEAGLTSGVIKIDVEGYEPTVIHAIARTIPKEISAAVVFESWDDDLDVSQLLDAFGGRASAFRIQYIKRYKQSWPKLLKLAAFALSGGYTYTISPVVAGKTKGDLVLSIR
ncbi:FkbM family methyltransferase [Cupriavidus lacunae]|uniref:Methyltransferase FkbM domain-containing protein n=1 Tax=Cupriavidus lacunae TaxID=2666307 RepID=A0A370NZ41_9BURK|nr:FkbM family methyltransferase [Cupriavidus lacunae]RDK10882.1 hypothetical protein DN412_07705 [Cupriavidus lacunae]